MSHEQRQRRRRDAVDSAGLADGPRPVGLQLMADLVRKPGQHRIIEIVGQNEAFVAPIGFHIGGLPAQIDVVFCVDLELLGDLGLEFANSGQIRDRSDTVMSG